MDTTNTFTVSIDTTEPLSPAEAALLAAWIRRAIVERANAKALPKPAERMPATINIDTLKVE